MSSSQSQRQPSDPTPLLPLAPRESGRGGLLSAGLVGAYLLLMLIGFASFRTSIVMVGGNEMSLPRALFTAVNAATLTGFRQTVAIDQILWPGQAMLFILTVAGTFITLAASGLAVVRIARLPYSVLRIIRGAILLQVIAMILGAGVLWGNGRNLFAAIFQSASAIGNSGLTLGPIDGATNPRILLFLMPLTVIGGIGLPVLMELWDAITIRRPISMHSRVVLSSFATVFLIGFIGCLWFTAGGRMMVGLLVSDGMNHHLEPWRMPLASALIASLNSRSAGFPLDSVAAYPRAMQWFVMLLMAVGGASAGTAGGIKTTTLFELARSARRSLTYGTAGRGMAIALTWIAMYGLIVFIALCCLLESQPERSADNALFTVISAVSNVGLAHDALSVNDDNGYVLSAAMMLGRLLPIAVLWWMALTTNEPDAVAVG